MNAYIKRGLSLVSCLVFFCGSLLSASAKPNFIKKDSVYFSGGEISPTLLSPPPKDGSDEWRSEIEYVIKIQKEANHQEIDKAIFESIINSDNMIKFLSHSITRTKFPALYGLLNSLTQTSLEVANVSKNYWKRQQPHLLDNRVSALVLPSSGYSYPSAHSLVFYVNARVLSVLFPENANALMNFANNIARYRVLVGLHYNSDIVASKDMSLIVVGVLMQNQKFLKDLQNAKKEILNNNVNLRTNADSQLLFW